MVFNCSHNLAEDERKIGALSLIERRMKIQKYLAKKKSRVWKKKISYDCRKRVADHRIRIKGRFIRKAEAVKIMQLYKFEKPPAQEKREEPHEQQQEEKPTNSKLADVRKINQNLNIYINKDKTKNESESCENEIDSEGQNSIVLGEIVDSIKKERKIGEYRETKIQNQKVEDVYEGKTIKLNKNKRKRNEEMKTNEQVLDRRLILPFNVKPIFKTEKVARMEKNKE